MKKISDKEFVKVRKFFRKNIKKWFKINDFIGVSVGKRNKKPCIKFLVLLGNIHKFIE